MIPPVLPTYARAPLAFTEGEGAWLTGEDGARYLDLGAGIAVNLLGHANPALVKALEDQARKLWHVSNLYRIPEQEALAARLVEHTFADTMFFTNSGTEAMELAVKMVAQAFRREGPAGAEPDRHLRGRLSRPVHRGDLGHQRAEDDRRVRAAAARFRHRALGRSRGAEGRRDRRDRRDPDRAGAGRGRHSAACRASAFRVCARSATRRGSCWCWTRCSAAWAGRAGSSRMNGRASRRT